MDLFHTLSGMVDAELTSADIPSALMAISRAGIGIYSVQNHSDLTANICVSRRDYPRLKEVCEKRGDTLHLLHRKGLYWQLKTLIKRPVLTLGIAFLLTLIFVLPSRVLFVRVEGNAQIPSRRILEAAEYSGIRFGSSRREVRSERVKNTLLQELPELQWAGVNTYGCVAVISVRERTIPEKNPQITAFGNIVALREGIISQCTATRGTLVCQPGQAVTEGQILISGYTDCGLMIQVSGAEGEVYAQTKREISVIMPAQYVQKRGSTEARKAYSLLIGKKRINLWKDSGIWDSSCGRIYEENYITLPGGFLLPIGWSVDTCFHGDTISGIFPEADAEAVLHSFADAYVKAQMIAGSIESEDVTVTLQEELYRLEGEYVCTEMIGKMQAEQIGDTNGENG